MQSPSNNQPPRKPKTLEELEAEMGLGSQHQQASTSRSSKPPKRRKWRVLPTLFLLSLLVGIPVGVLWVANLPYPMVRKLVADKAPLLLLPSYIRIESRYKQAIASVEQATRLLEQPTSPADLDLGEQHLKAAQKHLDALPLWITHSWVDYSYWGYGWYYSPTRFNQSRAQVAQLQAKLFQERNAQTLLTEGEQILLTAKQQYEQASSYQDKRNAIAQWRSALDRLAQIPSITLAGQTSRQKLEAYQRDFKETVGLAAENERIAVLLEAARQFAWQAAKVGQNPPHSVQEWKEVESLWKEAIKRLQQVPATDITGYPEAQKLLAQYQANLGQIQIRRQAEADSVAAFRQAQAQIQRLLAYFPANPDSVNRNSITSQLQSIINQLESVQNGTTPYLEAQELLLSAKAKLKEVQR